MITEDGQVFKEDDYEGYGTFGGKDIFALTSQLNGFVGSEEDARNYFFNELTKRWIEKDGKRYYYLKDFSNYSEIILAENKTPNQLISQDGWEQGEIFHFEELAEDGFKIPKIVEKLPSKDNWVELFNSLPPNKDCEFQGYFYEDEDYGEDYGEENIEW